MIGDNVTDPEIKTTEEWTNGEISPEEDEIAAAPATDADPAIYGEGE